MMSLAQIRQLSREQEVRARKAHKVPFLVQEKDIEDWKHQFAANTLRLPFPNIGDYRPKGYELVDTLFVDKTGWGAENEPALTIPKLLARLETGKAYAIIEEGEFQLYLGVFTKSGDKIAA